MGDGSNGPAIERLTKASERSVAEINTLLGQLKPTWDTITVADTEAILASPTRVYVAHVDATIIGMVLMVPHRHFGGLRIHVEDVVVRADHRRRGIARRLLETAIADAPRDAMSFDLRSHRTREAAQRLYTALGFVASDTTAFRRPADTGSAANPEG